MSADANRVLELISKLVVLMEINSEYIKETIASKRKMECKQLAYSRSLYDGVLKSSSHIVNALLQDKPDLYSIKRYYLKPMLEDYINLYNINKFDKEYARAMQIHFMSEDYDIDTKYREDYAQLGVSFNKSKEESKAHVLKKIEDHFKKLPPDLKKQFKGDRKILSVNSRFYLANLQKTKTDRLSVKAFYDYANVHHHFDLRFDWLAEENDSKFTATLLVKLEEYVTKSAHIFNRIFNIKPEQ